MELIYIFFGNGGCGGKRPMEKEFSKKRVYYIIYYIENKYII